MGSRNRNKKNKGFFSDDFWQSANFNRKSFELYRHWIISLALTRFRWEGLPSTCNARFLEWTLLTEGCATIASWKLKLEDGSDNMIPMWFSTKAIQHGRYNIYDDPIQWKSFGNNGWNFNVNNENGVWIWENKMRLPILSAIDVFARRLAVFDRVMDVNLQQQFTPYIITVPQEQYNAALQMYKQISGGEPAILGYNSLSDIDIKALNTGVEFKGEKLNASQQQLWNQVYNFLGIKNLPKKSERMIEDEVLAQDEPSSLMALNPLDSRREATAKLQRRFGLDVEVYWNEDFISDNFNYTHSVERTEGDSNE